MLLASTGIANTMIIDWNNIAHTNNGILCNVIPGARIFKIVVIIFIPPKYWR